MNAFEMLGLKCTATAEQVHTAYREIVKRCHPDRFQDKEEQERAQEKMIQLNLAYEEAMRVASARQTPFSSVALADAKVIAVKLYEQGRNEMALRQLLRADVRDGEWFFLQGNILSSMRQYDSASQSFREAVRRNPDNREYRRRAFDAEMTLKKHRQPLWRAHDTIGHFFGKR